MIKKIKNDKIIKSIIKHSQNKQIYLVGGCIRDFILGQENFDKDIIADFPNVREYSQELAEKLNATFIPLDEENKIYRLVLQDKLNSIDIASVIGKNLEEDLKRRDFTINSIAVDLNTMQIIDINSGIEDINNKIIRGISDKNFEDDALRLLRAYRFQSKLGFKLDKNLKTLIDSNYKNLQGIAIERINAELLKLFEGSFAHQTLEVMDGMLEYLFPIMKEVKKVPKNSHHHLPLFFHSIETVKQIQKFYDNSESNIKSHLKPRLGLLKLAGFLHDIGKPETWTIEEETGRHRFIKHDDVGSKLVLPLLKSLNFSKKQISYISLMIKNHIYPSQVILHEDEKTFMRFVRKMNDNVIDVITIAMADRLSARGPAITEDIVNSNINGLKNLLSFYMNVKEKLTPLPTLLDGNEIMKMFNIPPSKQLGQIISQLKEAQISGDVNTKSEAICYLRSIIAKVKT